METPITSSTPIQSTEPVTYVTQSHFFNPAFNAAIFDGPIRIYFAQYQEAQALKLYFNLQERFSDIRKQARGILKERGSNIFVMIYPTLEIFDASIGAAADAGASIVGTEIVRSRLGSDYIVGVKGPLEDGDLENLCREMDSVVTASIGTSV